MGRILIGTSSWSDPSLVKSGRFYPVEVRTATQRLRYYSSIFPIAEIDASFHAFPTMRSLDLWLDNTPPDFVFDIKAFSLFTQHPTPFVALPRSIRDKLTDFDSRKNVYLHQLPEKTVDELWEGFSEMAGRIRRANKLGVVLFQFPPWFHFREEHFDYIANCKERLRTFSLAIEFRTSDWLNSENKERTLQFLREQKLTLVCVDEPQGFKSSVPPIAEVTSEVGYIRFHGRNAANWEKKGVTTEKRFSYLYSKRELEKWVPRIRQMAGQTEQVHIIFKNKDLDYPIVNAQQLKHLLA